MLIVQYLPNLVDYFLKFEELLKPAKLVTATVNNTSQFNLTEYKQIIKIQFNQNIPKRILKFMFVLALPII